MNEKIIEIIREACALEEELFEDTKFNEISLDSLSFIEVIVKTEQEFKIEFEVEQINMMYWETIGDYISYVGKKVNEIKQNNGSKD